MGYGARCVPATLERQSSRSGGGDLNVHCLARTELRDALPASIVAAKGRGFRAFEVLAQSRRHAVRRWFNARGTLHNGDDTRSRLVEGLEQHLDEVRVEQVGCVALFSGRAFSV